MAITARRIFSVRPTSSEAERDFSAAGLIANKGRMSLSHESMNICTFCSINSIYVPESIPEG